MSSKSCVYILHQSMSVSLFSFDFVAPPPSVCFILCIVYVWSSCCVNRYIDFLVLTLILCSRQQLSWPLSVYLDICDYLDSDLCLFDNDFCLAPLNFFFHFTVQLGPFLHFSFTTRNTFAFQIFLSFSLKFAFWLFFCVSFAPYSDVTFWTLV